MDLTSPSEVKHKYLLRRITSLARGAKIIIVAWSTEGDHVQVLSPVSAISILPKSGQDLPQRNPDEVSAAILQLPV